MSVSREGLWCTPLLLLQEVEEAQEEEPEGAMAGAGLSFSLKMGELGLLLSGDCLPCSGDERWGGGCGLSRLPPEDDEEEEEEEDGEAEKCGVCREVATSEQSESQSRGWVGEEQGDLAETENGGAERLVMTLLLPLLWMLPCEADTVSCCCEGA